MCGLLNCFKPFIKNFATICKPLHKLAGLQHKRQFTAEEWTAEAQDAFETLKDKLDPKKADSLLLRPVDPDIPCHLWTDASDQGFGGVLGQYVDVSDASTGENINTMAVIQWFSKAWTTDAQRRKAPYYKELHALIKCVEQCKPFLRTSKHKLIVHCDHQPIVQGIKNFSGKGPVSLFSLRAASEIPFEIRYIPGKENVWADSLSRNPMLGPTTLSESGRLGALKALLDHLNPSKVYVDKTWFWAEADTHSLLPVFQRFLQEGKVKRRLYVTRRNNISVDKVRKEASSISLAVGCRTAIESWR